MDFKILLLILVGLIAGTFAFGWLSSGGGGSLSELGGTSPAPLIRSIEFPAQIMATGDGVEGTLHFADFQGDIVEARFEAVEAVSFKNFSIDLTGAAGITSGKFTFELHSSLSQEVVLNVTLIDALGHISEPSTLRFKAIGQPNQGGSL